MAEKKFTLVEALEKIADSADPDYQDGNQAIIVARQALADRYVQAPLQLKWFCYDGHCIVGKPGDEQTQCPAVLDIDFQDKVVCGANLRGPYVEWTKVEEKWELYTSVQGYDVVGDLDKRIKKLYMQLNAQARGDEKDADGDEVSPTTQWNNLVSATAYAFLHAVAGSRWAVNEHARLERVREKLQWMVDHPSDGVTSGWWRGALQELLEAEW